MNIQLHDPSAARRTLRARIIPALLLLLVGAFTGCVGYVDGPPRADLYVPSPSLGPEDFVYYPGYQVYYSSNRRQYVYQEGRSWVSRPAPRRVSAEVLNASPSVRLDFHDSPALHHATVVKQYPKRWSPPRNESPRKDPGPPDRH